MSKRSPFWEHISLNIEKADDGKSEVTITIKDELFNNAGTVQGGVLASLIDVATGAAISSVLPVEKKIVTTDLTIHYVSPGQGKLLTGKGHIKHIGRSLAVACADIINDDGQLVATGSASFRILE